MIMRNWLGTWLGALLMTISLDEELEYSRSICLCTNVYHNDHCSSHESRVARVSFELVVTTAGRAALQTTSNSHWLTVSVTYLLVLSTWTDPMEFVGGRYLSL